MTLYIEKKDNISLSLGYKNKHSTWTVLIKLRDEIERAMKSGEVTLAVSADFLKQWYHQF